MLFLFENFFQGSISSVVPVWSGSPEFNQCRGIPLKLLIIPNGIGFEIGVERCRGDASTIAVVKTISCSLLALGQPEPPAVIDVAGERFEFVRLMKHDFFAATALYQGARRKVVAKFGRQSPILGLPADWIGRFLAWQEARMYGELSGMEAVPEFVGRYGSTCIVHEFIEGAPLEKNQPVPDGFFGQLKEAIDAIHARDMAYVDLEKRQNVLLGDDGKPYLIDFQISWHLPRSMGGETLLARWVRRRLQEGDRYHLLKLQRRVRRDQLTEEQIRQSYKKPLYVRLHRLITLPLLKARRALLGMIDPRPPGQERGSIV